jgi:hypothetical protein
MKDWRGYSEINSLCQVEADITLGSPYFLCIGSANIWKTTYHSSEQNCFSSWYYFTLRSSSHPSHIAHMFHLSHLTSRMGGETGQAQIGRNVYTETMVWTQVL